VLLPVYFLIVQQSLQNRHAHFYANGMIIIHSHPVSHCNQNPINDHSHSKTEICFFHLLSFDLYETTGELKLNNTHLAVTAYIFHSNEKASLKPLFQYPDYRGPPDFLG
jgi:hypothetical protein